MKYEVDGKIFDSEEEAIEFCAEEMISTANIIEIEEETLTETSEEEPIEEDSITSEQYENLEFIKHVVENWDSVEEKDKEGLLRHMFGSFKLNREGDKIKVVPRTLKYESKNVKVSDAVKEYYMSLVERLQDTERQVCPICNRPYTESLDKTEELSWRETFPELEGKFPEIHITHVASKHPIILDLIRKLFEIPEKPRPIMPSPNPEGQVDMPKHMTRPLVVGHGETIPTEAESLSKEELSKAIGESEELRREFYKVWLRKLRERKE